MTWFANIRELFGWVLLGLGLAGFGIAGFLVLNQRMACSGTIVAGIGYLVFRGGLNLIKLAIAGRVAADVKTGNIVMTPERNIKRPVITAPNLAAPKPSTIPGPKRGQV